MSEAVQVQAAVISKLCRIPPFHSLRHIKYIKRHMFGILNLDEIKN
jgi:hypothetical protein